MSTLEYIYLACAIAGAIIFILRMILLVVGGFGGGDGDMDGMDVGDMDLDGMDGLDGMDVGDLDLDGMDNIDLEQLGLEDTDFSFRFLSIQGVSSFIMMFGIVGLAIAKASPYAILSLSGATGAGVFTVWVVSLIFKWMGKLQADGTMQVENAVEQIGTVYLKIAENGVGKVQIVVQGALRTLDAVSAHESEIKTGTKVKVVTTRGTLLVVEPIVLEE
jgi:membrane protein implicated in regulation of membrane protease activity